MRKRTLRALSVGAALTAALALGTSLAGLTQPASAAIDGGTSVVAAQFDTTLQHNIPNLNVQVAPGSSDAAFIEAYRPGGLTRWGYPTSEVMEVEDGVLTQYYQRGVLDWHHSSTCGTANGYCIERRLTWDYFGGGLGGSPDLGVEPGLINQNPGLPVGPWGHEASNVALDGTPIRFQDFFTQNGGVEAFGYPKTDARYDDAAGTQLGIDRIPGAGSVTRHFIRQYFQAAVMEQQAKPAPFDVELRLLGDDLRDVQFPGGAWKAFRSFRNAQPLNTQGGAQPYEVERVVTGPQRVEALLGATTPITELCQANQWQLGDPFCTNAGQFGPAPVGTQVLTGDVVRTRNASPDLDVTSIMQRLVGGVVQAFIVISTPAEVSVGPPITGGDGVSISDGDVAILAQGDSAGDASTPDGSLDVTGTLFLVSVRKQPDGTSTTTVKIVEGQITTRSRGRPEQATISSQQVGSTGQVVLHQGVAPVVSGRPPLTTREQAQVDVLRQLQSQGRLGKTPTSIPPLTSLTVTVTGAPGVISSAPAGINCGQTCAARFLRDTPVTLTATTSGGNSLAAWSGNGASACQPPRGSPAPTTCTVRMSGDQSVNAIFVGPIGTGVLMFDAGRLPR
jgi:hypothetical protein